MRSWKRALWGLAALAGSVACSSRVGSDAATAAPRADTPTKTLQATVAVGDSGMVVSAAPLATEVGVRVLRAGGNAVDAAVAVAFALSVVYPTAGNIGGGGFLLARMGGTSSAVDFREVAPLAATRDMYLDSTGEVTDASLTGALAAGVPGSVAGLWAAHQKLGSRPWRELLQPAIDLADSGFAADAAFSEDLSGEWPRLALFPSSVALFGSHGNPWPEGATWKSPELARTLRLIAEKGPRGFYEGETAQRIVTQMKQSGGRITLEDLRRYRPKWRTPVGFDYRGYHVLTMPPSSSGGLTIALVFGILGGLDLRAMGWHSAEAIHAVAESERMAFARRNTLLADPDFYPTPSAAFLSPDTAAALRASIAPVASKTAPPAPLPGTGHHTTHFSIVDAHRNAVSMTTTLNESYGSGLVVAGAGFLLNDEMDDFTTKVGAINAMGLRQGDRNAIQPGKRMLSSMTPTIVLDSTGGVFLVVGAAGGARIITAVAQIISNVVDFRMPIGEAMAAPRFHAQDYPDSLLMSDVGYSDDVLRALGERGYHVELVPDRGWQLAWAQSILRSGGRWEGVSEPRGSGFAAGY